MELRLYNHIDLKHRILLASSPMFYFYYYPYPAYQFLPGNQPCNFQMTSFQNGHQLVSQNNRQNSLIAIPQTQIAQPPTIPEPTPPNLYNRHLASVMPPEKQPIKRRATKVPFTDKHNIIPNNINHILAFAQRKSKSDRIVKKIIEKLSVDSENLSSKGFYSYQSYVKNKLSVHVNVRSLQTVSTHLDPGCSIFSVEEQLLYNKVCRTAIRYYLKEVAPLVTLNSTRLKNTNKQDHIKVQRYLLSILSNLEEKGPQTTNSKLQSQ